MSVKRKSYSTNFKAKLVLEVLEGVKTINEIASSYEVQPLSLKNWKKQFLENMSLAFDKSAVVKEYKYLLKDFRDYAGRVVIEKTNQVWSTQEDYIQLLDIKLQMKCTIKLLII